MYTLYNTLLYIYRTLLAGTKKQKASHALEYSHEFAQVYINPRVPNVEKANGNKTMGLSDK